METDRVKLAPSILAADFARLGEQVAEAEKPFFARVTSTVAAAQALEEEEQAAAPKAGPRGGVVTAPKVDYVGAYRLQRPYLTKLTLMALILLFRPRGLLGERIQRFE